jgi:hypothetical protein
MPGGEGSFPRRHMRICMHAPSSAKDPLDLPCSTRPLVVAPPIYRLLSPPLEDWSLRPGLGALQKPPSFGSLPPAKAEIYLAVLFWSGALGIFPGAFVAISFALRMGETEGLGGRQAHFLPTAQRAGAPALPAAHLAPCRANFKGNTGAPWLQRDRSRAGEGGTQASVFSVRVGTGEDSVCE